MYNLIGPNPTRSIRFQLYYFVHLNDQGTTYSDTLQKENSLVCFSDMSELNAWQGQQLHAVAH